MMDKQTRVGRRLERICAVGAIALITAGGCAGGHSVNTASVVPDAAVTSPLPTKGNAGFIVVVPPKGHPTARTRAQRSTKRIPSFVSPNAASVVISVNGIARVSNLTPSTPGCTQGLDLSITCTLWTNAPLGSDTFDVKLYDRQDGAGNLLSNGTLTTSIADAAPQILPITMNPYVGSVIVALPAPPVNACGVQPLDLTRPLPVTISAFDRSGAGIVPPGQYMNPITLSLSDPSGRSTLSATTVSHADDVVSLTYRGSEYTSTVTVNAQATGVDPSSITAGILDPGADRPLDPGSVARYAISYPNRLANTVVTELIAGHAAYPAFFFGSILPAPAGQPSLCKIISTSPLGPEYNQAFNPWAYFLLVDEFGDTNTNFDIYVASARTGTIGADTLLYAAQGSYQFPFSPNAVYGPEEVWPTPAVLGYLPHGATREFQTSATEALQTHYQCTPQCVQPFVDELWVVTKSPGSTLLSWHDTTNTGVDMLSQINAYQSTWSSLGEETVSSNCALGAGVPTTGVHMVEAGMRAPSALSTRRQPSSARHPNSQPGRNTGVIGGPSPTPVPMPSPPVASPGYDRIDEWVSRQVGVICRTVSTETGLLIQSQSLVNYAGPITR